MAAEGQNDIILNVTGNTRQLEKEIQRVANNNIVLNTKGFSQPLGKITGQLGEFEKSLAASNARVIAFGASAGAIYALQRAFGETVKSVVSVQKALIEINSILNVSQQNLSKFGNNLFEIAKNTGQSFSEVAKSALEFSRQGLSIEETLRRTSDALILTRLSGMDVVSSTEAITAALNSFNQTAISSTELINKLVAVDAAFAVSSGDLAEAIKRVGSSAQDVGVNLDELIAIVTSAQQTTARGGAVIGNSFKTIFTRLQRPKVLDALDELGVKTRDTQGNLLPLMQVLSDLSLRFDTLAGSQKAQIAELVGGVYQINILKAALGDLSKQYSIYGQALDISSQATDEAQKRNEAYNQSIASVLNKTLANLTKAGSEIGNITLAPLLEKSLDLLNSGLESMSSKGGSNYEGVGATIGQGIAQGLSNFLGGPGLLLASAAIIKIFERLTKYSYDAFKSLSGISAKSAEQQQLQAQILNLLSRNPAIIEQINKGTLNTTALHKDLLTFIQAETIAMERQLAVATTLAKTLMQAGVRVPQSGDLKGLPTKQMKYFGFIPNFNYEEAETMGAAMGGYKAGKVKTMNIPKEGKVIYNDAESVVKIPGFSQPAIMPPEESKAGKSYKKTFEEKYNFDPYKAFGHIPNFNRDLWAGPKGAIDSSVLRKGFNASSTHLVYKEGWTRLSGQLAKEARTQRGQNVLKSNGIETGVLKNDEGKDIVFVRSSTPNQLGDSQKVANLLQSSFSKDRQATATSRLKGDTLSEDVKNYTGKYVLVYPGFGQVSKSTSYGIDEESGQKYSFDTYPFPGIGGKVNIGETVYETARKNIIDLSKDFVSKLTTNPQYIGGEKFERGVQSNLGMDTISSFVGSAFEAGVKASIESVPKSRIDSFDLSKDELAKLDKAYTQLNLENYEEGDFKNSLTDGNLNSMAEKIAKKDTSNKTVKSKTTKTQSQAGSNKGFENVYPLKSNVSKGFVPNFSAIKEAMNREEEASGEKARVLWSDTLGTPVVVNNKQTAEYGANADRIIYNDHIKQGQYASYNNLMKTGSGREKYKHSGFIPNFAQTQLGERYRGLSNQDFKDVLDARKAGFGALQDSVKKLALALEDAQKTIVESKTGYKSMDVALKKATLKFNLTETETEKLNRSLNSASSTFAVVKNRAGKYFNDDNVTGSLKQFKDKAIFASFGLSMLGGFAQSLAGENKQLGAFFGNLSQSVSTATTVMGLIPGPAGIFAGALIGAGGAVEALWHLFNDKGPELEKALESIKQSSTEFNNSTQKYLNASQKLDEAIKNQASAKDIIRLNEELVNSASELPAAYRAQLLAITDNTELQQEINKIQKELNDKTKNLEFLSQSQTALDDEYGLMGSIGEGIIAGGRYALNGAGSSFRDNQFDRQNLIYNSAAKINQGAFGIVSGMTDENRKAFFKEISDPENTKRYSSMDKTAFGNELGKKFGLNNETQSFLQNINDQEFENLRAKIIQLGIDSDASAKLMEAVTEARKEYNNILAQEQKKIDFAQRSLEKFKNSLDSLSKLAIGASTFSKQYEGEKEANRRNLEIQKLSGMLDYNKPFMTESANSKLDYEIGQLRRNEDFMSSAREVQLQTRSSILDLGNKIIENAIKNPAGEEGAKYGDEQAQNKFRIALAELSQNKNLTNQDLGQAIKSAYQDVFKNTISPGDVKEINQNIDQLISEQGQSLLSLNQKLDIGNKLAEEQLSVALKQQEYNRQLKSFGGANAFLDKEGSDKKQSDRLKNIQRYNYINKYDSLNQNANTKRLPMTDYIELVNQTNEEYEKIKQNLESQNQNIKDPKKLYSDLFAANQSKYADNLRDQGVGLGRYAFQAAVDAKEMMGGISPEDSQGYERVKNLAIQGRTQDIMRQSSQMAAALRGAGMNELAGVYDKRARGDVARQIAETQINEAINTEDTGKNVKAILEEVKKITDTQNASAKNSGLSQDFVSALQNLNRDFTSEMRNLISQVKESADQLDQQTKASDLVKEAAGIRLKLATSTEETKIAKQQIPQKINQLEAVGISSETKAFVLSQIEAAAKDPNKNIPTISDLVTEAKKGEGELMGFGGNAIAEELSRIASSKNTQDEQVTVLNSLLESFRRIELNQSLNSQNQFKLNDLEQKINSSQMLPPTAPTSSFPAPLTNPTGPQNPITPLNYPLSPLNNPLLQSQNLINPIGQQQPLNQNSFLTPPKQETGGANFEKLIALLQEINLNNSSQKDSSSASEQNVTVNFGDTARVEGMVEMKLTSDKVIEFKIEDKSLEKVVKSVYNELDQKFTQMIEQLKNEIKRISDSNFQIKGKLGIPQAAPSASFSGKPSVSSSIAPTNRR